MGETIDKNTDVTIKCFKCGNQFLMDSMRMDVDGRNLVCRYCLDRRPVPMNEVKILPQRPKPGKEERMIEYFCKDCRYNFKRAEKIVVEKCPYCGHASSIMQKGSTDKIIADAAKMKDVDW